MTDWTKVGVGGTPSPNRYQGGGTATNATVTPHRRRRSRSRLGDLVRLGGNGVVARRHSLISRAAADLSCRARLGRHGGALRSAHRNGGGGRRSWSGRRRDL